MARVIATNLSAGYDGHVRENPCAAAWRRSCRLGVCSHLARASDALKIQVPFLERAPGRGAGTNKTSPP
jgi:hypothetical protein